MRSDCGILSHKGKMLAAKVSIENNVVKCFGVLSTRTAAVWAAHSPIQKSAKFKLKTNASQGMCVCGLRQKEDWSEQ